MVEPLAPKHQPANTQGLKEDVPRRPPPPRRFASASGRAKDARDNRPPPLGPAELHSLDPNLTPRIQAGMIEENQHMFRRCFEMIERTQKDSGLLAKGDTKTIDFDMALTIATDEEVGRVSESEFLSLAPELESEHQDCFTQALSELTFDASDIDFSGRTRYPIRAVVTASE